MGAEGESRGGWDGPKGVVATPMNPKASPRPHPLLKTQSSGDGHWAAVGRGCPFLETEAGFVPSVPRPTAACQEKPGCACQSEASPQSSAFGWVQAAYRGLRGRALSASANRPQGKRGCPRRDVAGERCAWRCSPPPAARQARRHPWAAAAHGQTKPPTDGSGLLAGSKSLYTESQERRKHHKFHMAHLIHNSFSH